MAGRGDDAERESRRILERIQRETDPSGSLLGKAAKGAHNHVTAADVDPADKIEYWGTRIGRALGLLLAVALLAWLVYFIVNRG